MSRLPTFIAQLSPIREILTALEGELTRLEQDAAERNRQLVISTADSGLAQWEQERALSSAGDLTARRNRVLAAMLANQTLTVEALKQLAVFLGHADTGTVMEAPALHEVILLASFEGRPPEDLSALREAVARRVPAHLLVQVLTSLPKKEALYHGSISPLSVPKYNFGAANAGNYLLFMGGQNNADVYFSSVDAYDANLVRSAVSGLNYPSCGGAFGSVGEFAVYAGGQDQPTQAKITCAAKVTAYNADLVRSAPADLSQPRFRVSRVSTPTHMLAGPGEWFTYNPQISSRGNVDAYDENLTHTAAAAVSVPRAYVSAACVGEYGIFAGGHDVTSTAVYNTVDIYDANLTRTVGSPLKTAKHTVSAASTNNYAFFMGGRTPSYCAADTEVFDSDLVKTQVTALSAGRWMNFTAGLENMVVTAGGLGDGGVLSIAESYDDNLTKKEAPALPQGKHHYSSESPSSSGTVGSFLLFAGGYTGTATVSTVDAYTLK